MANEKTKKAYASIKVTTSTYQRITAFREGCFARGLNDLPKGVVHPGGLGLSGFIELAIDLAERQLGKKK